MMGGDGELNEGGRESSDSGCRLQVELPARARVLGLSASSHRNEACGL